MKVYEENLRLFQDRAKQLAASDKRISMYRFILALAVIILSYQYFKADEVVLLLPAFLIVVAFFLLIKKHKAIRWEAELTKAKIAINKDELSYLKDGELAFENGKEFIDPSHAYSYDLDFFGDHSIFQHLNRTGTITGKEKLAEALLHILPSEEIINNQQAIEELKEKTDWRQQLLALAKIHPDSKESVAGLMDWTKKKPAKITGLINILSFLLPALTIGSLAASLFITSDILDRITFLLFIVNLGVLGTRLKSIKSEMIASTRIERILKQYSQLLRLIENTTFSSVALQKLQARIIQDNHKSSESIHQLALLFGRLDHIQNFFAGPALNGFLLYHLHVLRGLSNWRKKYANHIANWLEVIGEFEKFNSLASFAYNNESFSFPEINDDGNIAFEELGHPLIAHSKSVTNSINFQDQSFFILTGSNMSGKSTFLRTLGINMVLAGIGAPVYAKSANIHPLPVLVSMRLSDSLTDSESYFYAEVKRLKYIMDQLEDQSCFVLLDEILRGTNSDDKRNGTIEVIKKMAAQKVYGGIATHDLEVCKVADEYPDRLVNKRFEVEIVDDELVFDYQLRDGVCQNKSASFIMKKMGVI